MKQGQDNQEKKSRNDAVPGSKFCCKIAMLDEQMLSSMIKQYKRYSDSI